MTNKREDKVDVKMFSQILQVSEFIDFFVLSEILDEPKFQLELNEEMAKLFDFGVNLSYLSKRMSVMREKGQIEQYWDNDLKRKMHYSRITESGRQYHMKMLKSIPAKVKDALKFYNNVDGYLQQFEKWDLSK